MLQFIATKEDFLRKEVFSSEDLTSEVYSGLESLLSSFDEKDRTFTEMVKDAVVNCLKESDEDQSVELIIASRTVDVIIPRESVKPDGFNTFSWEIVGKNFEDGPIPSSKDILFIEEKNDWQSEDLDKMNPEDAEIALLSSVEFLTFTKLIVVVFI